MAGTSGVGAEVMMSDSYNTTTVTNGKVREQLRDKPAGWYPRPGELDDELATVFAMRIREAFRLISTQSREVSDG